MGKWRSIELSATPGGWRLFSVRRADNSFLPFKKKVLERDFYTCQYCGFMAKQHQEVVNLDGNYLNNKLSNLTTACCFCSQGLFLEAVGRDDYGGGGMIFLPEMSQSELNGLCHVLFCAMFSGVGYFEEAQEIYSAFKSRSKIVEDVLGEGMSDPALLGRVLIDMPLERRDDFQKNLLASLRLLPSYSKFRRELSDWSGGIQEDLH